MNVATLTIILDDAGSVQVGGDQLQNKMLCYGLLELAKEAIQIMHTQAAKSIVAPSPGDVALLSHGNGNGGMRK